MQRIVWKCGNNFMRTLAGLNDGLAGVLLTNSELLSLKTLSFLSIMKM